MRKSIIALIIGISVGIALPSIIVEGYNIDLQNANASDVYKMFGFILGGYTGCITLLIFSIVIPVLLVIPEIGIVQ